MSELGQVSVQNDGAGTTTIVGTGELDLHTKGFGSAVKEAAISAENLIVDMREVRYIDTLILANLAASAMQMRQRGKQLKVLLTEGTHPLRVMKMSGFEGIMDFDVGPPRENVDEAG